MHTWTQCKTWPSSCSFLVTRHWNSLSQTARCLLEVCVIKNQDIWACKSYISFLSFVLWCSFFTILSFYSGWAHFMWLRWSVNSQIHFYWFFTISSIKFLSCKHNFFFFFLIHVFSGETQRARTFLSMTMQKQTVYWGQKTATITEVKPMLGQMLAVSLYLW